jgi:putative ABC transport system ATP-binding protein
MSAHHGRPIVEATGLTKTYAADGAPVRAVDGVDLVVEPGETVSVMGPSGCGKSTLLHLLGGLDRPDAGEIVLDGRRVERLSETAWAVLRRRTIGFVFQSFNLVDELTAVENVELPALLVGASTRRARRRALDLLERLDVADRRDHLPDRLSGGENQRVALARALINDPLLVLADEPTGNLDSRTTGEILRLFADVRASGQSLLVVTHDARVASTADRLLTMRDGALVGHTHLGDVDPARSVLAGLADLGDAEGAR